MISDHHDIENSMAALLLGIAEPAEADAARAHLEGCANCRQLVRRLQRAISGLPLAVEPVSPPARLRDRILAGAAASPQASGGRPQHARVVRLPRAPARTWLRPARGSQAAVAVAALVALALGGGLGLGIGRMLAPTSVPPRDAVAQYSMSGSGSMSGAQGRVFELRQQGLTLVQFSGLAQLRQGKIYELWLIPKDGQPEPGAVFAPDSQGGHVVVLARNLSGLKALAVTEEAAPSGSSAPTQQPQLVGSVA